MSITGTRLTMISLYTLQRLAHFSPQDSIASVWFLALQGAWEDGWPRHSLSEVFAPYVWVDSYTYFPLHLLVYHCKSSHNLVNYARAHNSLRLHTEVSSMNNLMIPLNLGGGPKEKQAILEYPGTSIHPDVSFSCHLK